MYSNIMLTQKVSIGSVTAATSVLGDKWTPELLCSFLVEDTVRFCQLQTLTKGINPRTLSARLASLEKNGIIEKINPDATRCEYRLTQKGHDLLPVLRSMEDWSRNYGSADIKLAQVG